MTGGGWAFVLVASGFVVFALWLAFSRYGKIPLGADGEGPEFRTVSWIAMMFSAGMGIGLMFYGVSEPLTHFTSPPPGTVRRRTRPRRSTSPWPPRSSTGRCTPGRSTPWSGWRSPTARSAAAVAQLISSAFAPLLGERHTEGAFGKAVDILAIFATLFGSAASLGLGTLQIGAGLEANGLAGAR